MNKVLYIILISLFSLTIYSCSSSSDDGASTTSDNTTTTTDDDETTTTTDSTTTPDTTAPVIGEVTVVTTPTNDKTPDYTFSSTEAGTITYGGSCSSSTTSATTDNNTITFSTLDNGTYSNCTIKVTDSAENESNTLEITAFTVTYWQLIARQVDSDNFTVAPDELFSSNARSTFLQNEDNSSSSTFMSIVNLTPSNYVTDGKYKFRLEWDGLAMASANIKEVIWTQTSWLDNSTIADFQEIGTSDYASSVRTGDWLVVPNSCTRFFGLGKASDTRCVIDGNGSSSCWWNCVGVITKYQDDSMPGPLQRKASSMHLYIWVP